MQSLFLTGGNCGKYLSFANLKSAAQSSSPPEPKSKPEKAHLHSQALLVFSSFIR
jgi:hypothetical protein